MRLFNPDSTHWYTRQGEPRHTVPSASGEPRPTTIRDARRLELLPSVTNVLGVIAKPDLVDWKMEQAVLAALTLPRRPGEPLDAFAARVVEDSRARVKAASEFGTAFHSGAQRIAESPIELDPEDPLYLWLRHYRDWFQVICERVIWAERTLVCERYGFAGTADLLLVHREHGLTLVDIKTQNVKPGRLPKAYSTWVYQLAAYRQALGENVSCINIIVDSSSPQPVTEHIWSPERLAEAWELFQAAHRLWRAEKAYNPMKDTDVTGVTESQPTPATSKK